MVDRGDPASLHVDEALTFLFFLPGVAERSAGKANTYPAELFFLKPSEHWFFDGESSMAHFFSPDSNADPKKPHQLRKRIVARVILLC